MKSNTGNSNTGYWNSGSKMWSNIKQKYVKVKRLNGKFIEVDDE